jgi:hypothetical protein
MSANASEHLILLKMMALTQKFSLPDRSVSLGNVEMAMVNDHPSIPCGEDYILSGDALHNLWMVYGNGLGSIFRLHRLTIIYFSGDALRPL